MCVGGRKQEKINMDGPSITLSDFWDQRHVASNKSDASVTESQILIVLLYNVRVSCMRPSQWKRFYNGKHTR